MLRSSAHSKRRSKRRINFVSFQYKKITKTQPLYKWIYIENRFMVLLAGIYQSSDIDLEYLVY